MIDYVLGACQDRVAVIVAVAARALKVAVADLALKVTVIQVEEAEGGPVIYG
jgi:hypothetical protein